MKQEDIDSTFEATVQRTVKKIVRKEEEEKPTADDQVCSLLVKAAMSLVPASTRTREAEKLAGIGVQLLLGLSQWLTPFRTHRTRRSARASSSSGFSRMQDWPSRSRTSTVQTATPLIRCIVITSREIRPILTLFCRPRSRTPTSRSSSGLPSVSPCSASLVYVLSILSFLIQLTLASSRPCGSSSAKTSSGCAAASKSAANTQSSHKFQHTCHYGLSVHRGRLLSSSRTLLAFIYCARAVFAPYTSLVVQSVHCSFTHVMCEGARSQRHECSGVSPHLQDLELLQCLSCHHFSRTCS